MGEHIPINGHPTWVTTAGISTASETVLLLHGGLSQSDLMLEVFGRYLGDTHRVVAFDRRGHGRTADTDAPFRYADMVAETIGVLGEVVNGPAHLVGWSDGGIVAMLLAMQRPDLVVRLVLIGTSFNVDGQRLAEPDPEMQARFKSEYAERSPDGPDHYDLVVAKSVELFASEPRLTTSDVARIGAPTLVLVGDDDAIELSHTSKLYESLPNGRLAVVPGASHLVIIEKPNVVGSIVRDSLVGGPLPRTLMPSRRSATG